MAQLSSLGGRTHAIDFMTQEDREWLESEFQKLHIGIAAILGNVGLVDADVRAFRDAMLKAKDNPKISGSDMFDEYAVQFQGYCATIDMEPERAASHIRGVIDSAARIRLAQPPKEK